MKNQVNMPPPKETNKPLMTNPKEMEIYELPSTQFRTVLLKFSKLQEHKERTQLNNIQKTMHEVH